MNHILVTFFVEWNLDWLNNIQSVLYYILKPMEKYEDMLLLVLDSCGITGAEHVIRTNYRWALILYYFILLELIWFQFLMSFFFCPNICTLGLLVYLCLPLPSSWEFRTFLESSSAKCLLTWLRFSISPWKVGISTIVILSFYFYQVFYCIDLGFEMKVLWCRHLALNFYMESAPLSLKYVRFTQC